MHYDSNNRHLAFSSLGEMARFGQSQPVFMEDEHMVGARDWYGPDTGAEALQKAMMGDDKGVAEAGQIIDKLQADFATMTVVDEPTVAGCYPIVPEALMGEPECMRLPTMQATEAAPVTVLIDLVTGSDLSAQQYRQRGLTVLAFVLALSQRRPVTLRVGSLSGSGDKPSRNICISAVIDTAPLDVARAAWALTNISCPRRLFYAFYEWQERQDGLGGWGGRWPAFDGVPQARVDHPGYIAGAKRHFGLADEDLYIPGIPNWTCANPMTRQMVERPAAWIEAMLEKYSAAAN